MSKKYNWKKSSELNFPDEFNDGFLRPDKYILFGTDNNDCNEIDLSDEVCVSNIFLSDAKTMNKVIEKIKYMFTYSEMGDDDYFLMTLWKDKKSDYVLLATFGCFSPEEDSLNEISINMNNAELSSNIFYLCDDIDELKGPEKAWSRLNDDYSQFLSEDDYVKIRDLLLNSITTEKLNYLNGCYDVGNILQERLSQKEKEIILEQINAEDKKIIKKRI